MVGLLYYHARYYDSALAKFISPDTIVPGASGGSIGPDGNVAAAGLTVSLVEDAFAGAVAEEHRGFLATGFFDNDAKSRSGPANPQALNRYSYVLNGPVRWVDPSGHFVIAEGGQFSFAWMGNYTSLTAGFALDTSGNVRAFATVSGGGTVELGGVAAQWARVNSTASEIEDMGGVGQELGVGLSAQDRPLVVGVEVGHGTDRNGNDTFSLGYSAGVGRGQMPFDIHGGVNVTTTRTLFNIWEVRDAALEKVGLGG